MQCVGALLLDHFPSFTEIQNYPQCVSGFDGDLVGRALNERYRLLALLGTGSSARVYLAHDVQIARQVAVKVLHASLAEDPEFLRRFRIEAEALGQLTHPNIVTVHDFNDGANALGEPPYLVTNYLEGGSLRNLLDQGYRLTPSQAARLGLDAARGLAFAHARGYVHRDIKPANLLFTDDQRAHVADFGLARAKAEAARTEADTAPVGTMRYLAPEQVVGNATDKSDVYALALVLVESVTGVVPFSRDNWQSTAFARTVEDLRAPEIMGDLGAVINAAGIRDLARRIDAATFVHELEAIARRLPALEPLPLDGARVLQRGRLLDGRDPTRILVAMPDLPPVARGAGAVRPQERDPRQASESPAGVFDQALFDDETIPPRSNHRAAESGVEGVEPSVADEADKRDVPSGVAGVRRRIEREAVAPERAPRRRLPTLLASLVLFAVVGGLVGVILWSRRPEMRTVPRVEQMTLESATQAIEAERLAVATDAAVYDEKLPVGQVVSQDPRPPLRLKKGATVTLTLSKGPEPVTVPSLEGLTLDQATAVLRAANLSQSSPSRVEPSETVPEGNVISWTPRDAQPPGTVITLVVSSGPPTVVLPKVNGLSPDDARAALPPKLDVTVVGVFADNTPKGLVVGTNPKSGTEVAADAPVKLLVSRGPASVVVPNVINMSPAEAAAALRSAGLKIGSTVGAPDMPVLFTRPVRRSTVKLGTVVTLYTTSEGVPPIPGQESTTTAAGSGLGGSAASTTKKPTSSVTPSTTTKKL